MAILLCCVLHISNSKVLCLVRTELRTLSIMSGALLSELIWCLSVWHGRIASNFVLLIFFLRLNASLFGAFVKIPIITSLLEFQPNILLVYLYVGLRFFKRTVIDRRFSISTIVFLKCC